MSKKPYADGSLLLHDVEARRATALGSDGGPQVAAIGLAEGGDRLLTGGREASLALWSTGAPAPEGALEGLVRRPVSVGFTRPRELGVDALVVGFGDPGRGAVRTWDLRSGRVEALPIDGRLNDVAAVGGRVGAAAADGAAVVVGGQSGSVVHRLASAAERPRRPRGGDHAEVRERVRPGVTAVALSPDGQQLLTGDAASGASLWDLPTSRRVHRFREPEPVLDVAYSPDGRLVAVAGGYKPSLYEVDTRKRIRFAGTGVLRSDSRGRVSDEEPVVSVVAFDQASTRLGWGTRGGKVAVLDLETRKLLLWSNTHVDRVEALALSPDGAWAVSGGWDQKLHVWRIAAEGSAKAEPEQTLDGHGGPITSLAFSPDGTRLASTSVDGRTRLWDTSSWTEIASLVGVGESDWVVLTPEGYYASSKSAFRGIGFDRGGTWYPFEQFDLQLNRPDIVYDRLGTVEPDVVAAFRQARQRRLRKLGVNEAALRLDAPLPEVRVDWLAAKRTGSTLTFDVVAEDPSRALTQLHLWVDDVPVFGSAGRALSSGRRIEETLRVELTGGSHKVQVSVRNEAGAESLRATGRFDVPAPATPPQLHVVAIGVSEYADRAYDLAYAADDAAQLGARLAEASPERFRKVHVHTLLDGDATRERILAMRSVLEQTEIDDHVVLFVAGHGLLDDELNLYFGTPDVDFDDPARGGLAYEALEGLLDGIPARHKLLLMDTCHSGELDREGTSLGASAEDLDGRVSARSVRIVERDPRLGDAFRLMQESFANLSRGTGATVISAAAGEEYAYEGVGGIKNGVFTHSVLEALPGGSSESPADTDGDGVITVSELSRYVVARVRALTGGRQTPTSRRENLEIDFPVF